MNQLDDFDLARQPDDDGPPEGRARMWTGILALAVAIGAGAAVYFLWFAGDGAKPGPAATAGAAQIEPAPESGLGEELSAVEARDPALPALDESDSFVRDLVSALSAHPDLARWVATPRLVRTVAVSVDNVAEGRTPVRHLTFLGRPAPFRTSSAGERVLIDERSYQRYNAVADVVASMDAAGMAHAYLRLRPLFADAYRELGHPAGNFDQVVERAIRRLLETPVVDGAVDVAPVGGTAYAYADQRLQSLSEAQRQLLRMGPRNTRLVQAKLRELARALDIPDDRLPRQQVLQSGGR
jgi:hypothetical protein